MKIIAYFTLIFLIISCDSKQHSGNDTTLGYQFPDEDRTYEPGIDKGTKPYRTTSLYGSGQVVLTYDDGPHRTRTPKVLDELKKYDAKATFFLLGTSMKPSWAKPIVKRIIDEGHIIALHTITHKNSNHMSEEDFKKEMIESIKLLRKLGWDKKEIYFRFPYGAYGSKNADYHHFEAMKKVSMEVFGENCINFVFWDIDSSDWFTVDEWGVKTGVKRSIENITTLLEGYGKLYDYGYWKKHKKAVDFDKEGFEGGVILMHDINKAAPQLTRALLEKLDELNYQVRSLAGVEEYLYEGVKTCNLQEDLFN